MQVNWRPYIPILAGGIGYGLGFCWTGSHVEGVTLAVIAIAQCVFIYFKEVDEWVSEERRWKLHQEEMLSAFKFSLISYAVCLEMNYFSIVDGLKFLTCCVSFLLLMPLYSDYFMSQKKLQILKKCVSEKVQDFLKEYRKQEVSAVEKIFFNQCMNEIDHLLNEFSIAKSNRVKSLSNQLLNKVNILIRSSGTNSKEFQYQSFAIKVDGKLQNCHFSFHN